MYHVLSCRIDYHSPCSQCHIIDTGSPLVDRDEKCEVWFNLGCCHPKCSLEWALGQLSSLHLHSMYRELPLFQMAVCKAT